MSFEQHETLPQALFPLAQAAVHHAQTTGQAIQLTLTTHNGTAHTLTLLDEDGAPLTPELLSTTIQEAVTEAEKNQVFTEDGTLTIASTPEAAFITFTPAPIRGEEPEPNPGDLSSLPTAPNNGLALLAALKKHGNTGGYSANDIDAAEQELGATFSPEIRFYRSNIKDGKVADGPHGDVLASPLTATFAAGAGNSPLPVARPSDIVQPLREHKLWIEIAHDALNSYAADLAPGAAGAIGQIIGRPTSSDAPPRLVARSLAQFVDGDWVDAETAQASWTAPQIKVFKPYSWQVSAGQLAPAAPEAPAPTQKTPAPAKKAPEPVAPVQEETPKPAPTEKPAQAQEAEEPAQKPKAEPAPEQRQEKAQTKPRAARPAQKRAQRVSFEVNAADFSAAPSAMNDDFIDLAPIIDSKDIAGIDATEIIKHASPIHPELKEEFSNNLPASGSIFAVNKIPKKAKPTHTDLNGKSSEDIAHNFAASAFGDPEEEETTTFEDHDPGTRDKGGIRKAFKRFFG